MSWSSKTEIRSQLQKLWDKGALLSWMVAGESPFPIRLRFKVPTSSEISSDFGGVQTWIANINAMRNCRLVTREFKHPVFGRNSIPEQIFIDTAADCAAWLHKEAEIEIFKGVVNLTRDRVPALLPWLQQKPLMALTHAGDWNVILDVVLWIQRHPRPGIYIRQVTIPRVHTKFIEEHKAILAQLFDQVLPEGAIDQSASPASQFERRYGFRTKPERIRFRLLEEPCRDVTLDTASFASLNPKVRRVVIVENEINFLSFPALEQSMVIFGAGYGFDSLGKAKWLSDCLVYYWGDIDTHGFAILHELRRHFPHVQSLMMDEETVLHCRPLWGREKEPHSAIEFSNLTPDEAHVYRRIKSHEWKEQLRIEQEHIEWRYATERIHAACKTATSLYSARLPKD